MKKKFSSTLRFKITFGVALPMLLGFVGLSVLQYFREEQIIHFEMSSSALSIGDVMVATLEHAMSPHDNDMLNTIINNTVSRSNIVRIQLIDKDLMVQASNISEERGTRLDEKDGGCKECHSFSINHPLALQIVQDQKGILRVATPIDNEAECQSCHGKTAKHIGILLIDVSDTQSHQLAQRNVFINLMLSLAATFFISLLVYIHMHRLATSRIEAFAAPLDIYSQGDFSIRLPISKNADELDDLAIAFNHMMRELELHVESDKLHAELLQRAIIEERERIARELHDSLPQLLAYLNTKIGAIRLFITRNRIDDAVENLEQLEFSSRRLLNDIREAIIGLRMSRKIVNGLIPAVKAYVEQFTQFCGLPVDFNADTTRAGSPNLEPATQVHILRIIQESLSNVRKHANATRCSVDLHFADDTVTIRVKDDGQGFDPFVRDERSNHFGLQIMRERAESVGGRFDLVSERGKGTTITVTLKSQPSQGE